jgi:drug/metabolite transporter (DMT)-like permease
MTIVLSFVGVVFVADPLQAWSPNSKLDPTLANTPTNDGLPHDLFSKAIGIVLVLTCAMILGTESE